MDRESRILEYKRDLHDLQKLARTVVAFANGDGGKILVGVDDRSRRVVGLSPDRIDDLLERVPVSLADQIQPPVYPQLYPQAVGDREVLVIQVFPSHQKPCFLASEGIERGAYIRVGAHTRRAQGELLDELRLLRSRLGYDEEPLSNCTLEELDTSLLPAELRSAKALHSLGAYRHDPISGKPLPTRGAVLMLHPTPERHVAEATLLISRTRGESGRQTVESHELTGNLPLQADAAVSILEQWLGRDLRRRGSRYRPQHSALPLAAVREVLSNALFHRQYSIPGSIKVALYPSRLEVFSPGHFAGPFVPEQLGDGTSYIRNRIICLIARRLGLIEKRGTGIRLIQESMHQAGLPAPHFEEGPLSFKVTLRLTAERYPAAEQPDHEAQVLAMMEKQSDLASRDVCRKLGLSRATAVAVLNKLVSQGRLRKIGRGPQTRYVLGVDN